MLLNKSWRGRGARMVREWDVRVEADLVDQEAGGSITPVAVCGWIGHDKDLDEG
jgi:hypothetical protein